MPKETKIAKIERASLFLAGLERLFPEGHAFPIAGRVYTKAMIVSRLLQNIARIRACDAAFAQFRAAVAEERRDTKDLLAFLGLLKLHVRAVLPPADAEAVFRLRPLGPGPKSAETKKRSVEKARATRAARWTMGKRQKAKIR